MSATAFVHDGLLDPLFQAAAERIEQAILYSLWHAESVTERDNHRRVSLCDLVADIG